MFEIQKGVDKFRDEDYYGEWSNKVLKMSEKYHISNITKLYREL